MTDSPSWSTVIRFKQSNGDISFGEPSKDFKTATLLAGSSIFDLAPTTDVEEVKEVNVRFRNWIWQANCPLQILPLYVPNNILCIGLNYIDHAQEAKVCHFFPNLPEIRN
jgi:2-keto-4-pentenoate hydratase/2-oxohepta-3-ene-1,7-dioic acid hydratase in catechol pathway